GALARANGRPSDAAVAAASVSRSCTTSMWSLTKPTGTTTTADGGPSGSGSPLASVPLASAARWSFTSGSSQGTLGGPLRLWKTRSNGREPPRTRSEISRAAFPPPAPHPPPPAAGTAGPVERLAPAAGHAPGALWAGGNQGA